MAAVPSNTTAASWNLWPTKDRGQPRYPTHRGLAQRWSSVCMVNIHTYLGQRSSYLCMIKGKLIQSTLVISNSKGLTETLRDIRTSTYQSWESEENNKLNNHIDKWICNLTPEVRNIYIYIYIIMWKRGEIAPQEQFLLFSTLFCYLLS